MNERGAVHKEGETMSSFFWESSNQDQFLETGRLHGGEGRHLFHSVVKSFIGKLVWWFSNDVTRSFGYHSVNFLRAVSTDLG